MTKRHSGQRVLALIAILALIPIAYASNTQPNSSFHGVGVMKSATPFAAAGDVITYMIRVYNPSDFDLHNITVIDALVALNRTIPFIAARNTTGVVYTINHTVLESDPNPLMNDVSVKAVDSEGVTSTASTQAKTTIIKRWISVEKTGPAMAHEGDSIRYGIVVRNLANATLHNVTLQDEVLGFGWKGDLSAGETNVFNLTYAVPAGSQDPLTNKVTASATLNNSIIYAEDEWTVDILHPRIDVKKMVKPTEVCKGGNVTYLIIANNTGDTDLFNLTLVDSIYGSAPASLIPTSLKPAASILWSINATIKESVVNVATASGVDALGRRVSDEDKAAVKVRPTVLVRIEPETLNLKSEGKWVTARIEVSEPCDASQVDLISLRLWYGEEYVPAEWGNVESRVLMVKFSRTGLEELLHGVTGEAELILTGRLDGVEFEASDSIRVISPGKD